MESKPDLNTTYMDIWGLGRVNIHEGQRWGACHSSQWYLRQAK